MFDESGLHHRNDRVYKTSLLDTQQNDDNFHIYIAQNKLLMPIINKEYSVENSKLFSY